jgi:hypothetical protein
MHVTSGDLGFHNDSVTSDRFRGIENGIIRFR